MFRILDKNVTGNKILDTLTAKGVLRLFFVKKSPGVIVTVYRNVKFCFLLIFRMRVTLFHKGAGARSLCPCMASAGLNGRSKDRHPSVSKQCLK